jgi:hypothetical protein
MRTVAIAANTPVVKEQSKNRQDASAKKEQKTESNMTDFYPAMLDGITAPGFTMPRIGADFSQIPIRPALRTAPMIQRICKGDSPCSCPECSKTEESEGEDAASMEEMSLQQSVPESVAESVPEEQSVEQSPVEVSSPASPETSEMFSDTPVAEQESSTALIADDSTTDLAEGQMKKTEFMQQLRLGIRGAIEPILATVGQTTDGCPYLNYWLDLYQQKNASEIESTVKKYAPNSSRARTGQDYISLIVQRAVRSAAIWARTGRLSGIPEGVPTTLPDQAASAEGGNENSQRAAVQAKAKNGGVKNTNDPQAFQSELGNGQPLEGSVRSRMESAFGMNFSHVRTHTDANANNLSNHVNARAFTVGNHVAFGAGEYKPGTMLGDALIAHELAHTIQQSGAGESIDKMEVGTERYNQLENDADQSAIGVMSSLWSEAKDGLKGMAQRTMPMLRSGLKIQRCKADPPKTSATPKTPITDKTGTFTDTMVPYVTGLEGTIEFMPDVKNCPVCTDIRLVQILRIFEKPGEDYVWAGSEGNRNKVKTEEDKDKSILPGYHVDHKPGCDEGKGCGIYYRDHWPNSSASQNGSNDGTTATKASLWDRPKGDADDIFQFETCARCHTTGAYLRSYTWGFTADSTGKATKDATSEAATPSATFLAATAKFDTFYGN